MKRLAPVAAALLRAGAALTSRGGRNASLLVLMYHRVLAHPDPLLADEPAADAFGAELDLVQSLFTVLGLGEAVARLATGSLPRRAVALTFDDGYVNNLDVAAPLLAARGLTATVFVATGFIGGDMMWNDKVITAVRGAPAEFDLRDLGLGAYRLDSVNARRSAIDDILGHLKYSAGDKRARRADAIVERVGVAPGAAPMMSETQLRRLAALGMELGAHTVTHPILSRVPDEEARREIFESKRRLEDIVGLPVRVFAYPNGRPGSDYTSAHVRMVRDAGFNSAVSTAWGAATRHTDQFQIPRISAWDQTPARYGLRLVRGFTQRRSAAV